MESMNRRLKDPKAYCVFYIYFYAAALGEVKMKDDISQDGRIGNNTTDAFAFLMLENNYKAWLFEEKEKHKSGLWTEYDTPPSSEDYTSIVDYILGDCELNLDKDTDTNVIQDKEDRYYKSSKKNYSHSRILSLESSDSSGGH